ncbi:MAG: hypothetical protein J6X81_02180 [Muribaculaceae bacterium]|nr:hypothetical protein [Muribaculaceae bacterium]
MKPEDSKILQQLGKEPGFKVPENFFADINEKIKESLPEVEITRTDVRPSLWVRIRPYVYMAAMFAGVWCMMKVFNGLTETNKQTLTAKEIAAGMNVESNVEEFILNNSVSDMDIIMSYEDSLYYDNLIIDSENNNEELL